VNKTKNRTCILFKAAGFNELANITDKAAESIIGYITCTKDTLLKWANRNGRIKRVIIVKLVMDNVFNEVTETTTKDDVYASIIINQTSSRYNEPNL